MYCKKNRTVGCTAQASEIIWPCITLLH